MLRKLRTDENGAEAVEFAFVAPIALTVIFGIIYILLALAAHVSLNHATSVAVRYASIPVDPVATTYPKQEQVHDKLTSTTPFFAPDRCTTIVAGDEIQNAPVTLEVSCDFPNPAGAAFDVLRTLIGGTRNPAHDTLTMTTAAEARRE